jgi:hypothetical protein
MEFIPFQPHPSIPFHNSKCTVQGSRITTHPSHHLHTTCLPSLELNKTDLFRLRLSLVLSLFFPAATLFDPVIMRHRRVVFRRQFTTCTSLRTPDTRVRLKVRRPPDSNDRQRPVGQRSIPAILARGGTSNGLVIWKRSLPGMVHCMSLFPTSSEGVSTSCC